jgi:hypothetical protein
MYLKLEFGDWMGFSWYDQGIWEIAYIEEVPDPSPCAIIRELLPASLMHYGSLIRDAAK